MAARTHHIPGYGDVCHPWLTQWVVYDRPTDFPEHVVARRWSVFVDGALPLILPSEDVITASSLEPLREALSDFCMCIPRWADDDPKIVEVWM